MEEKIDKAIQTLLDQIRTNLQPDGALKQSQAVLNMMHAKTEWLESTQTGKAKPKAFRENSAV